MKSRHLETGFAAIAAIFLVVILAALGAFMVTFSNTQQLTSVQDLQGTRAYWAARAGLEWGIGTIFSTAPVAPAVTPLPACFSNSSLTIQSFTVAMTCSATSYVENDISLNIYKISATASAGGAVGSIDHVERSVSASLELP